MYAEQTATELDNKPVKAWHRRAFAAMYAAAALTPLLVFVLPLFVPTPPARAVSASFLAGFNNEVAIVSAVLLSVAVLVLSWWIDRGRAKDIPDAGAFPQLPAPWIAAVVAFTAAVQTLAGWLIVSAHQRNLGDAGYIIEQATVRADTGRALYTQIEFAYGPLLIYPEIWLSRLLNCSMTEAYFALLVIQSAVGLLMLAFVLNHLPIQGGLRKAAFVLLGLAAITPHWGMNYTLFRFASPLFVIVWGARARSPWRCTWMLTAGIVLELLISPELGLATAAGVLTFGAVRAWQSEWRWLPAAVVPVGVLAVLLMTLGRPFFRMAAIFTGGALNLPVGPYPHILLLLFALVWLVPRTVGQWVDLKDERGACLLAYYATAIAFMPAALGRCDPLHVIFNGTGVLALSLMAFNKRSPRAQRAWVVCLALAVLWDQRVNYRIFQYRDAVTVREAVLNRLPARVQDGVVRLVRHENPYLAYLLSRQAAPESRVDMAELKKIVGSAPVATPMEISPTLEMQLRSAHLYSPGFFAFWTDTMNVQTERRVMADADAHRWMLIPASWQHGFLQLPRDTGFFQGVNLHYTERKPILYHPGILFDEDLEENWTAVWSFGSYILYEHTGNAPVPDETSSEDQDDT